MQVEYLITRTIFEVGVENFCDFLIIFSPVNNLDYPDAHTQTFATMQHTPLGRTVSFLRAHFSNADANNRKEYHNTSPSELSKKCELSLRTVLPPKRSLLGAHKISHANVSASCPNGCKLAMLLVCNRVRCLCAIYLINRHPRREQQLLKLVCGACRRATVHARSLHSTTEIQESDDHFPVG